jgi:hypothetical protein
MSAPCERSVGTGRRIAGPAPSRRARHTADSLSCASRRRTHRTGFDLAASHPYRQFRCVPARGGRSARFVTQMSVTLTRDAFATACGLIERCNRPTACFAVHRCVRSVPDERSSYSSRATPRSGGTPAHETDGALQRSMRTVSRSSLARRAIRSLRLLIPVTLALAFRLATACGLIERCNRPTACFAVHRCVRSVPDERSPYSSRATPTIRWHSRARNRWGAATVRADRFTVQPRSPGDTLASAPNSHDARPDVPARYRHSHQPFYLPNRLRAGGARPSHTVNRARRSGSGAQQ